MNFPKLLAAQSTLGVFGFTGGMFHYFLLTKAYAIRDRRLFIAMSSVWAVIFAGAVTPLFFTFGTPVKMAIFALSFFAVSGALGGMVTTWLLGRKFDDFPCKDIWPVVVIWAIGLGLGGYRSISPQPY